jgi:hypothetical protein
VDKSTILQHASRAALFSNLPTDVRSNRTDNWLQVSKSHELPNRLSQRIENELRFGLSSGLAATRLFDATIQSRAKLLPWTICYANVPHVYSNIPIRVSSFIMSIRII